MARLLAVDQANSSYNNDVDTILSDIAHPSRFGSLDVRIVILETWKGILYVAVLEHIKWLYSVHLLTIRHCSAPILGQNLLPRVIKAFFLTFNLSRPLDFTVSIRVVCIEFLVQKRV